MRIDQACKKKAKSALAAILPKSCCAILMLHRVAELDRNRLQYNDHLKVSPSFLDHLIAELKRAGYAFLSMDEVVANAGRPSKGKTVALTFDDGYRDNFEAGYEVLKANETPATVYVSTGLSSGDAPMWWNAIEDFLLRHDEIAMPSGECRACHSLAEKNEVFLMLRDWVLSLHPDQVRARVGEYCQMPESGWLQYAQLAADDDTLRRFSDDALVSIGCHTHRHIPCGLLDEDVVKDDIRHAMKRLKGCGIAPRHFAFPYGDDESDANRFRPFFEECGFVSAVTTFPGTVVRSSNPYYLPRLFVSEYADFGPTTITQMRVDAIIDRVKSACRLGRRT